MLLVLFLFPQETNKNNNSEANSRFLIFKEAIKLLKNKHYALNKFIEKNDSAFDDLPHYLINVTLPFLVSLDVS